MTRITTECPTCGRVEISLDDVTLVVSPLEDRSWYLFDCLCCASLVVKPAPGAVANALESVRARVWTVPAEMLERIGPDEAPALRPDDVLDAVLALREIDDLVFLAEHEARCL